MTERLDLAKDSTMTKAARVLADAVKKYAPYDAIKKTVRIGKREGTAGGRFITVKVGKKRFPGAKGAEYAARAFDVGSGIHGRFNRTYKIVPIHVKALSFYWENMGIDFVGKRVNHPGVRGVHYMKSASKEARPKIKKIILEDAKKSIRLYLKAEFAGIGK